MAESKYNSPHFPLAATNCEQSNSNKFQYSIELQDDYHHTIAKSLQTGQKVSLSLGELHTFTLRRSKKFQNNESILLHFRLTFAEEKYRKTERETIEKWFRMHEDKPNLLELKDALNDPEVCEPVKVEHILPTNWIYLWKSGQECEFDLEFHATSNQFPILKDDNQFEPTLFLFIVDLYSAAKKAKLDSVIFQFKVFWSNKSIKKAREDQPETAVLKLGFQSFPISDLLPMLNLSKLQNLRTSDFKLLKSLQPGYGLFVYTLETNCVQDTIPKALYKKSEPNIFTLNNVNFLDKSQMLKTTVQLCFDLSSLTNGTSDKDMDNLCAEWKICKPKKKMLDFGLRNIQHCRQENYNNLTEIYSYSTKQVDIFWSPKEVLKISLKFNFSFIDFHSSTVSNGSEMFLAVQTYKRSPTGFDILVDSAFCQILDVHCFFFENVAAMSPENSTRENLNKSALKSSNNLDTAKESKKGFSKALLKTQSNFVIHRILFISIGSSEYKPLYFQGFNYEKFKQDLLGLIAEVKPQMAIKECKISKLTFFLDHKNKEKHYQLVDAISLMSEKAVFDCKIVEVTKKSNNQILLYEVEMTSQEYLIPSNEFNYF